MSFRPDFKTSRSPEIFGRILNLPILAFQTSLIEFLFKSRPRKSHSPFIPVCRMQMVIESRAMNVAADPQQSDDWEAG
jgi:hypothetical protein